MNLEDFVRKVEDEFDEIPTGTLTPDAVFRELLEWNSVNALLLMALISSEFDVNITVEELQNSATVRDLYEVVKAKM